MTPRHSVGNNFLPSIFEATEDRDLLEAEAVFYQYVPVVTVTNTMTVTETNVVTQSEADNMLVMVGGSIGGIIVGLLVGVIVGKRMYD